MAVAWTADGVGQATKDWLVRDPVVVQASLPRFLAPGDTTRLRLDLAHATGPAGAVAVTLTASDPGLLPEGGSFSGALGDGGRLTFDAPLAGAAPGDDTLTVETTTPGGARLTKHLTRAGPRQRPGAGAPGPHRARRRARPSPSTPTCSTASRPARPRRPSRSGRSRPSTCRAS